MPHARLVNMRIPSSPQRLKRQQQQEQEEREKRENEAMALCDARSMFRNHIRPLLDYREQQAAQRNNEQDAIRWRRLCTLDAARRNDQRDFDDRFAVSEHRDSDDGRLTDPYDSSGVDWIDDGDDGDVTIAEAIIVVDRVIVAERAVAD